MEPADEAAPPFLGRWRYIYAAVLLALAVDISLLYLFTQRFR